MGKKIIVKGAKRPFYVREKGESRRINDDRRSGEEIREDVERQVPGRRSDEGNERRNSERRKKIGGEL